MFFGSWTSDGSDDIHAPYLKRLGRRCWMEMTWCIMDEVTMNLIDMTPLRIGDNIGNHHWPVVAKYSESVPKFGFELVSSVRAIMSFPEGFLCDFVWKAAE